MTTLVDAKFVPLASVQFNYKDSFAYRYLATLVNMNIIDYCDIGDYQEERFAKLTGLVFGADWSIANVTLKEGGYVHVVCTYDNKVTIQYIPEEYQDDEIYFSEQCHMSVFKGDTTYINLSLPIDELKKIIDENGSEFEEWESNGLNKDIERFNKLKENMIMVEYEIIGK